MSYRLLRRRRTKRGSAEPASEDTGLLDVLANLVGVLALFAAITSLLSASGDIKIHTPMNKPSGRAYVLPQDMTDIAADVLRHRMVLSYDALSEGMSADDIVTQVLQAVPAPDRPFDGHVRVPTAG